jgi:hypothetical protein
MKKIILYIPTLAIILVAFVFSGMRQVTDIGHLEIDFSNYVGDKILQLDSVNYKNDLGQDFTISNFKYYVGNFHLFTKDGKEYISKGYHLLKADDVESRHFTLTTIPDGDYESMSFTLGVDSIDNCSGAQSGALDPANGMFWAWNSGYIFMKLEGKAKTSNSSGHIFEYHIGGYKQPNNCIRTVKLDLKNNPLKIRSGESGILTIKTDALEILKTPTTIDFSKLSSVTDFHHATEIADNYKDMFSVLKVENEK